VLSWQVIGWSLNYFTFWRTKNNVSSWALVYCHRAKITQLSCHLRPSRAELVAQSEAPVPSYSSSKVIPVQVWTGPKSSRSWGFQISRYITHEGGNVVRHTHRPSFTHEIFLVLVFVRGWVNPQGYSVAGRIISIKNFNDTIEDRFRDFPSSTAVLQPTNLCIILLYFSLMMILTL